MDAFAVLPISDVSNAMSRETSSGQLMVEAEVHADSEATCPGVGELVSRSEMSPVVVGHRVPNDTRWVADVTATDSGERSGLLSDRQRAAWEEMHERMERRRRDWNTQVDRMRTDFFKLKRPTSPAANDDDGQLPTVLAAERGVDNLRVVHVEPSRSPTTTRQQFQASFDLSDYSPDEIKVQTDGRRLIVRARHEQAENDSNKTVSREFSRQVDIPRYVEASRLRCTLSERGVLTVDADTAVSCLSSPAVPLTRTTADRSLAAMTQPPPSPTCAATSTLSSIAPLVLHQDGNYVLHVSVPLGVEFDADDLTVKTVDRRLIVTAQHDEAGPGRRAVSRQLSRQFNLPDAVNPDTVTAHVTDDGQLVVEAPLPPPPPQ